MSSADPLDVDAIRAGSEGQSDSLALEERQAFATSHKARVQKMREVYAGRLFKLLCYWLAFVAVIVVLASLPPRVYDHRLEVSDNVQIALVATTAVNVISLFLVVAKHIFPERKTVAASTPYAGGK